MRLTPPVVAEVVRGGVKATNGSNMLVLRLEAPATVPEDAKHTDLEAIEFFLDGRGVARTQPQDEFRIPLTPLAGGVHELRVVMEGEPRLAPRKTVRSWFAVPSLLTTPTVKIVRWTNDTGETTEGPLDIPKDQQVHQLAVPACQSVTFQLSAVGADRIELRHFQERIATVDGEAGEVQVDLSELGSGPIRLRPVALFRGSEVPGDQWLLQR